MRAYFEARNRNDDSDLQLLSPGFVRHSPPTLRGLDAYVGWKRSLARMWADERWTILDMASSGQRVWTWLRNESTHVGEWHGLPATGRRVAFETVNVVQVDGHVITDMWRVADDLTRVSQLGGEIRWPSRSSG